MQWGSTPERAKEVIKRTKEDKDLSFQVGVGIIGARRLVVNGPMSEAGDVCRGGSIALGFMKSARPGHTPLGGGWVGSPIYSQCWTQWFPKKMYVTPKDPTESKTPPDSAFWCGHMMMTSCFANFTRTQHCVRRHVR